MLSTLEFHLKNNCLPLFPPEAGNTYGHLLHMMGSHDPQHHIQKAPTTQRARVSGLFAVVVAWRRGADAGCAAHLARVLSSISPGKDQNSTFQVQFLLSTYFSCTIVKLKNQSPTIIVWEHLNSISVGFSDWYIPAFPVLKMFGDCGNILISHQGLGVLIG